MIKESGEVLITKENITIRSFNFTNMEGENYSRSAAIEAIEWANKRLLEEREKIKQDEAAVESSLCSLAKHLLNPFIPNCGDILALAYISCVPIGKEDAISIHNIPISPSPQGE